MKIASKFRDYYDSAATYGIDPTIVYVRATSEPAVIPAIELIPYAFDFKSSIRHAGTKLPVHVDVSFFLVGFCGSIYPGARVDIRTDETTVDDRRKVKTFVKYSADELNQVLKGLGYQVPTYRYAWSRHATNTSLNKFFVDPYVTLRETFFTLQTPVFMVCPREDKRSLKYHQIVANPSLLGLKFQTVKDPHTAFQDIQMYLSGVLGMPSKPMVKISDKEKARKAGHDGEYSFRTPPGTKKSKRKKKP